MTEEDPESPVVFVLDRTHPDFEQHLWSVRWLFNKDPPFAKWVASPERGRFIVLALIPEVDLTAGEMLSFAANEHELAESLRTNLIGRSPFALHFWLKREVLYRVLDMLPLLKPLEVTIEWHPPSDDSPAPPITHG